MDNSVCDPDVVNWQADSRSAFTEPMRALWIGPSPAEAAAWGSFSYEDDQAGGSWFPAAGPCSLRDFRWALYQGGGPGRDRTS